MKYISMSIPIPRELDEVIENNGIEIIYEGDEIFSLTAKALTKLKKVAPEAFAGNDIIEI